VWERIRAHVDEVFFGNVAGVAETLNVDQPGNPVSLKDRYFAGVPTPYLAGEDGANLYDLLRAVGTKGDA
jgi:hypothetical protein